MAAQASSPNTFLPLTESPNFAILEMVYCKSGSSRVRLLGLKSHYLIGNDLGQVTLNLDFLLSANWRYCRNTHINTCICAHIHTELSRCKDPLSVGSHNYRSPISSSLLQCYKFSTIVLISTGIVKLCPYILTVGFYRKEKSVKGQT